MHDDGLITFLNARLDEDERVALAACGRDGEPGEPEHWHWECTEDDAPIDIDLAIAGGEEYLEHGDHYRVGLRSVEQYPTRSVGPIPHLVLGDEEVSPQDARHIARHDPARVLREVQADRKLLAAYAEVAHMDTGDPEPEYAYGRAAGLGEAVRLRAASYGDHPDYRQEWKP